MYCTEGKLPELKREELLKAISIPLVTFYEDTENQKKFADWLSERESARKEEK